MFSVTDLKNGATFLYDEKVYKVLDYEHIKMSRGSATVKLKVINILSGTTKTISFSGNVRVDQVNVENKNMKYLYSDSNKCFFMDLATYFQYEIDNSRCKNERVYLVEGYEYQVTLYENQIIAIILPASLFLSVKSISGNIKGSSGSTQKEAVLENGLRIYVPDFIKVGERIKVNTSKGTYSGRS